MATWLDKYDPGATAETGPPAAHWLDKYDPVLNQPPAPEKPPGMLDRIGEGIKDYFSRDVYVETPAGQRVKLQTPTAEPIRSGMAHADNSMPAAADPMAGIDPTSAYSMSGPQDPARTALETAASLGSGMLSYPGQVTLGLTGIASGMDRPAVDKLTADFARATTYAPQDPAAQRISEAAGKGFDILLWPAHKLDEAITELGYPRAAYVARVAAELATFKGLHAIGKKAPGFLKQKFGLSEKEAGTATRLADDARTNTLRDLFASKLGLDKTTIDQLIPEVAQRQAAISAGQAVPYNSQLAQVLKSLSEQSRAALPPGQGFTLVGAPRGDARLTEGIRQIKARLQEKKSAPPLTEVVAAATNRPRTLGLGKPKKPATRLRGRIEELGKISWSGERGEMVDMPRSVSYVSNNKSGKPWRDMEAILKDEGWLEPGESLPELLRTDPSGTLNRRHPADFESIFTDPGNKLTKQEREMRRAVEQEPDFYPDEAFWEEQKRIEQDQGRLDRERQEQEEQVQALGDFFTQQAQKSGLQVRESGGLNQPVAAEKDIVNPVDPALPQHEKAMRLRELGQEVKPVIEAVLKKIDAERGTESKTSFKKIDRIVSKANRPSIKAEKPWHDVEHVRDSFRFKTVANNFEDIEAALKGIRAAGGEIVKLDTDKMIHPKEWGWRVASVDIRRPNGLLVEFYAPLKELEAAKKAGNHALFEKWRNVPQEETARGKNKDAYLKDLETSNERYTVAFERALKRLGLSRKAAEASWNRISASLSDALSKKSFSASAENVPASHLPAIRTIPTGSRRESTMTRSLSRSIDTTIETPPDPKLIQETQTVNPGATGGVDSTPPGSYRLNKPRRIKNVPPPRQIPLVFSEPRPDRVHPAVQAATESLYTGRRHGALLPGFTQPGRESAIRMRTTGNIRGKNYSIRNADEAASLLAPLRKGAQEEAFLIVTDKAGHILEVERHSKGMKASSQVDSTQLAGRVFNTPGAKKAYFVHNHPSGNPEPSAEDYAMHGRLEELLGLRGVKLESLVIGRNKYATFGTEGTRGTHHEQKYTPILRPAEVPVRERALKPPKYQGEITQPAAVRDFLEQQGLLDTEGAIFLDSKMRPTGIWKYEKGRPASEFGANLISAAERNNAGNVIPFFKEDILARGAVREAIWNFRDASGLVVPDLVLSDSGIDPARASYRTVWGKAPQKPQTEAIEALKSGPTLYGGLPVHELTKGMQFWEKYVGGPLWDKLIMKKIPNALEKIPVVGRGVSAARRALDYEYRGDLPDSKGYVSLLDETRHRRQLGAEYGIDLGNRLSQIPEQSQLRIGQAITGHDVPLNPAEASLASEATWAMLELGKQAVDYGLLSEETFFKNAGKYMPRLYTKHEYQGLLKAFGEKAPNRLDLDRFKRRKDLPKELRQEYGEILTPGYPVAKGIVQLTHSIETAKWLHAIAHNPQWATTATPAPEGWVKLSDNPKLGPLSGAHVHPEVARDVQWTMRAPDAAKKIMRKWLSRWKYGKVVLSGKTHIRNMYSNALLAHLGGMPLYEQPLYLARAAHEMRSGGKYWRMAKREGLLSSTYIQGELRSLFDQVENQMSGIREGSLEGTLTGIGKAVNKIRSAGKKLGDVYQAEEQWFKLAKLMHNIKRRGMTPKEAAADANKWLFDYGRVTRFQERYRNSLFGAPFATFTFKAIPRVLEAAVKTPHRYVLPAAIVWALEEAARSTFGDTPEQAKAKKGLRPAWMQGHFMSIPNFTRVPAADQFGREYWLNLSYILPWGELGESGGLFGIPAGLMPFSHPLTKEVAQQLGGKGGYDWFWDESIVKPEDTAGLSGAQAAMMAFKKRGMHALQTMAPTPVMDAMKLMDAARGKPDYRGRERTLAPVLADVGLGLKAYPVDYEEQALRQIARLNPQKSAVARRIRSRIRTAQVKRNAVKKRGGSTELYDRQIDQARQQLAGLLDQARSVAGIYSRLRKQKRR